MRDKKNITTGPGSHLMVGAKKRRVKTFYFFNSSHNCGSNSNSNNNTNDQLVNTANGALSSSSSGSRRSGGVLRSDRFAHHLQDPSTDPYHQQRLLNSPIFRPRSHGSTPSIPSTPNSQGRYGTGGDFYYAYDGSDDAVISYYGSDLPTPATTTNGSSRNEEHHHHGSDRDHWSCYDSPLIGSMAHDHKRSDVVVHGSGGGPHSNGGYIESIRQHISDLLSPSTPKAVRTTTYHDDDTRLPVPSNTNPFTFPSWLSPGSSLKKKKKAAAAANSKQALQGSTGRAGILLPSFVGHGLGSRSSSPFITLNDGGTIDLGSGVKFGNDTKIRSLTVEQAKLSGARSNPSLIYVPPAPAAAAKVEKVDGGTLKKTANKTLEDKAAATALAVKIKLAALALKSIIII